MRSVLLLCVLATTFLLVLGAPLREQGALCPSLPVQLELRPSQQPYNYQLVFAAIDPNVKQTIQPEFVDIHYRVNNDDSVNLRVLTEQALTDSNLKAKQATIDGVILKPGDILRAYATYSAKGYACDTPMHTFNAPDHVFTPADQQQLFDDNTDINTLNNIRMINNNNNNNRRQMNINDLTDVQRQRLLAQQFQQQQALAQVQQRSFTTSTSSSSPFITQQYHPHYRNIRRNYYDEDALVYNPYVQHRDQFYIQSTGEEEVATCPSIPLDQEVLKIMNEPHTYLLSFENKNPLKQLHYVDLHLTTDENPTEAQWQNLRLASDMQLNLAHKVMQPGIVIKPNEILHYYWSYRTTTPNGLTVDCTTPITSVAPQDVTRQIDMKQLNQLTQ